MKVVLGEDLQRLPQFKKFGLDLSAAMRGEQSMWTHEQKHSLRGVVRGVQGAEDVPLFPSANVFDYGEEEELPYGPRSPFALDRVLEVVQEVAGDRGESTIPRTREEMVAHLEEVLPRRRKQRTLFSRRGSGCTASSGTATQRERSSWPKLARRWAARTARVHSAAATLGAMVLPKTKREGLRLEGRALRRAAALGSM